ncbi:axonemal dynein light intermediate polypeptide 1 [Cloeon dipterum]|uniref:axonemal dynein light intermediate polypeptide 1 n=1 Tax=Cloeon dipterum TaxID=197152 RepID=UPI00322067DC
MAEKWKQNADSLVEYDIPMLVNIYQILMSSKEKSQALSCVQNLIQLKGNAAELEEAAGSDAEILHSILPPRQWEQDGQIWIQKVSPNPATREKVQNLAEEFDMRLSQRHARETGICPVRRELYSQIFDELIRQSTLNCSEAGLLLARVRNELQMTLSTYEHLYESAIAFGIRKSLQSVQGQEDLEETVYKLKGQINSLQQELTEEKARNERAQQRLREKHDAEEKKHREEVLSYKKANQQLKTQLEAIIAPKK